MSVRPVRNKDKDDEEVMPVDASHSFDDAGLQNEENAADSSGLERFALEANDKDEDYLPNRPRYAWVKYIRDPISEE